MARGWESKSIESQQEDAAGAKALGPELTAAERDRLQQRRSLELALAHTQAELIAACRAAHRDEEGEQRDDQCQVVRGALQHGGAPARIDGLWAIPPVLAT
jgi:hypothetical protein